MKTLSWNVRGASFEGLTQQVLEFIDLYQQNILFLMEAKVNSTKAKKIIKRFSFQFPLYVEVSPVGSTGGLGFYGKTPSSFKFMF